jgi:hypothetical protein
MPYYIYFVNILFVQSWAMSDRGVLHNSEIMLHHYNKNASVRVSKKS